MFLYPNDDFHIGHLIIWRSDSCNTSVHGFLQHADTTARSRVLTLHRQANKESSHKHAADYMEIRFPSLTTTERKHGSQTPQPKRHRNITNILETSLSLFFLLPAKIPLDLCLAQLAFQLSKLSSPAPELSEQQTFFKWSCFTLHKYIFGFFCKFWMKNYEHGWFIKNKKKTKKTAS